MVEMFWILSCPCLPIAEAVVRAVVRGFLWVSLEQLLCVGVSEDAPCTVLLGQECHG